MNSASVTPSDLRTQLEQVRDVLWARLSTPGMRADALAPVAKAYMEACLRLDALPNDAEGSVTDDLSKRRASRRDALGSDTATGS